MYCFSLTGGNYLLLLLVVDAIALQRKPVGIDLLLHYNRSPASIFFGFRDGHAVGFATFVGV